MMTGSDRSLRSSRYLGFILALMVFGATVGCGGSDGSASPKASEPRDPTVWVADFCGHLNVLLDGIGAAVTDRDSAGAETPIEDLVTIQANVTAYFERWKISADTFVSRLGSIGHPDLPGGEIAVENFRDEYGKISSAASDALTAVAALPTDDPAAFWIELENIESAFGQSAHLGEVAYPAPLVEFFDAEPTCAGWGL